MAIVPIAQFSVMRYTRNRSNLFNTKSQLRRWRKRIFPTMITSCSTSVGVGRTGEKNYYELLGISVDSSSQEIKDAYRKLQKVYHPDIAGKKGHEFTLKLNHAYKVLMREDIRRQYDTSIGEVGIVFDRNDTYVHKGYSVWNGPSRPHALFVDETACIGCGECAYHASNTFVMDQYLGCARVKVQYGDDADKIEVSVDSCLVNCIQDLPLLEPLIRPKPKQGFGVLGQG
ncbi:Chaperone protein dnaJ C76, chloroplastic [Linum perenne]